MGASYLGIILSGATTATQIAITMETHTEVIMDPASSKGQYLSATEDSAYDPVHIPNIVKMAPNLMALDSASPFEASSFLSGLKKIGSAALKVIRPVASKVANFITGGNPSWPMRADRPAAPPTVEEYLQDNPDFYEAARALGRRAREKNLNNNAANGWKNDANNNWRAAGFGAGAITQANDTHFSFPAVREADTEGEFEYRIIPIRKGEGSAPDFVEAYGGGLYADTRNVTGRSSDLSFAVALMSQLGFPIIRGCYTGQVEDFQITSTYDDGEIKPVALFELLPVDHVAEKFTAEPSLRGLFPDGWIQRQTLMPSPPSTMFGRGVLVESVPYELSYPFPPGSKAYSIRVTIP